VTITVGSRPEPRTGDHLSGRRRSGGGLGLPVDRREGLGRVVDVLTGAPVVSWVAARIAVLASLAFARYLVGNLGAADPAGRPPSGLVGWDASWYLRIIESGYQHLPWESLRFFPLLPLLAKVVSPVIGPRPALLLVVNAASLAAAVLLQRLVRVETGDRALAARACWFLALLPPAFVFVMGYAESLLVCLSIGTFLALRRRRWGWAIVAGLLAGLCRPLGVLLVVPAAIEAARDLRHTRGWEQCQRAAAVVAPGVGGLLYLAWSWVAHDDPLRPLRLQQEYDRRGGFEDPVSRLIQAAHQLLDGADLGSGLHFPWAIGFLVLVVVCFRRFPASYGAFAAVVLLVALSAGNLDSLERYGLSAFPIVIALASLLRWSWLERTALALAASGMTVYATLAFLGSYVP
jgi:hypothetical protein